MGRLTTKERKALPKGDFALPGGRYPIPNASHGRAALSEISQHGTPAEKAVVRRKVKKAFPDMKTAFGK